MEVVLAAQILLVIDFLFGGEACGAHIRCFSPTPWCDCVIYGPPVARTSDLYDDTELTMPVLVMAQCAPQPPRRTVSPCRRERNLSKIAPEEISGRI